MSNISKLAIKACKDNTFSSFSGEFVTSINPENLIIKSAVEYHVTHVITGLNLLRYSQSPPRLLTFSLLFDNTGIIPGSNTIHVMEQVQQLQDVAFNVNKKNNAPNYIRIIWGEIDFKGRLVDLNVTYSMFQTDGTLIRAEASISVLEEHPPSGGGKSALGKENDRVKRSASAPASITHQPTLPPSYEESFAPTPNGTNGAYSGAPPGAYNGGPDNVYSGTGSSSGVGSALKNNTSVSDNSLKVRDVEVAKFESATIGGGEIKGGSIGGGEIKGGSIEGGSSKGGVAGNGPGGCGGGSEPGSSSSGLSSGNSDTTAQNTSGSSGGQSNSSSAGSDTKPSENTTNSSTNFSGNSSNATNKEITKKSSKNSGGNSLRQSKTPSISVPTDIPIPKLSPWQRLALMAKKVCTKGYNAAKKAVS